MLINRLGAAAEVVLVLALFLVIGVALRDTGFGDWQEPLFGRAIVSSILLLFILPMLFVLIKGSNPDAVGLTIDRFNYHTRVAFRAIMFVAPVTALFPVIAFLGSEPPRVCRRLHFLRDWSHDRQKATTTIFGRGARPRGSDGEGAWVRVRLTMGND